MTSPINANQETPDDRRGC